MSLAKLLSSKLVVVNYYLVTAQKNKALRATYLQKAAQASRRIDAF